ncbi:MAG: hypothetical protein ACKV2T_40865 [Kofleriaceae bacterium]
MKVAVITGLIAISACNASTGTLELDLATAPGSTVLSAIDRLRLTLTSPAATYETTRSAQGLDLAFEIEAVETEGEIYVEGFDASGARIVVGQSPPFPLAGTNGRVVIYVAAPFSFEAAPTSYLEPPRSQVAGVVAPYGAVLAGGLDAGGVPSTAIAVYNIYDHTIGYGENMPAPRASPTLAANDTAGVYIFGGTDENAMATSTLYRFQTNVAPRGTYAIIGANPGLESSGQTAIELGPDSFFVTGTRPVLLEDSTITQIQALANVPATATGISTSTQRVAAFVRESAVGFYAADGTIGAVPLPTIDGERAIVTATTRGTAIVVGGSSRDIYLVTITTATVETRSLVLSVVRRSPTVAATSRHVLVANGFDETGTLNRTADILDATTLELLRTVPLDPRANAVALPMPNDQILITGGLEPGGIANGYIELFTPPVPTDPAPP